MNPSAITGRRLTLNAIGKWNHSGKFDYDHGCRRRSRATWRNDARTVKRRVKAALARDTREQLEDALAA